MQAARRPIHLRVELSPRVQRAHDHFERGFVLELRVRIDGNAAPVVGHADEAVGLHLDLDEARVPGERLVQDRKSTRLNSSHGSISYAVFCLKKKKKNEPIYRD